jgi:CheY-like chemotaxis protein
VKQDVVLVASEDAETRRELAERLDWDDVPFHLASSAEEALEIVFGLPGGLRLLVLLDFERLPRATVMDALRARPDLSVQLLLLHDAQEDGLTDEKVVEHVRRPAVAGYLYSLVERHGAVA